MKAIVIIDDKDHAMKQVADSMTESQLRQFNLIHFDSFELYQKQKLHKVDILFLDFFLSKDRIFGKDIIESIKCGYLVCFSSKKEMCDAMAKEAVVQDLLPYGNVFSVQKLKKQLENPELKDVLAIILRRMGQ